jgi:hypothetical protein
MNCDPIFRDELQVMYNRSPKSPVNTRFFSDVNALRDFLQRLREIAPGAHPSISMRNVGSWTPLSVDDLRAAAAEPRGKKNGPSLEYSLHYHLSPRDGESTRLRRRHFDLPRECLELLLSLERIGAVTSIMVREVAPWTEIGIADLGPAREERGR